MKLNSKTRELIKEGTKLKGYNDTYEITTVIKERNGILITVRCNYNRLIYAMPLSSYYGLEIVKE